MAAISTIAAVAGLLGTLALLAPLLIAVGTGIKLVAFSMSGLGVAASGGAKSNGVAFTSATASGSWGTLTDVFISDASSGGNVLAHDVMTTALAVGSGGVVNIAVGELDITLD